MEERYTVEGMLRDAAGRGRRVVFLASNRRDVSLYLYLLRDAVEAHGLNPGGVRVIQANGREEVRFLDGGGSIRLLAYLDQLRGERVDVLVLNRANLDGLDLAGLVARWPGVDVVTHGG